MTKNDWISVLDRLPEADVEVLVFASISGVHEFLIASIDLTIQDGTVGGWWVGDAAAAAAVADNIVTHWAPLVGPDGETAE